MEKKTEIRLCMGSSCYSRGNDQILTIIKNFLDENHLTDTVDFRGHLCQGNCKCGPNLKIEGKEFNEVSQSSIRVILKEAFTSTLKASDINEY